MLNFQRPPKMVDTPLIKIEKHEGMAVVSSRVVAGDFGKQHKHVLETINNLSKDLSRAEFSTLFIESQYKASNGKMNKEYLLTRDGFSLLVMGFTGKEALQWNLKYIEALKNEMTSPQNCGLLTESIVRLFLAPVSVSGYKLFNLSVKTL